MSILAAASFPERTLGLVLGTPIVSYWKTADFPWGFTESDAREWEEWIDRLLGHRGVLAPQLPGHEGGGP